MASATLKSMLRDFIQSMYDEGIVNENFCQLQVMKDTITPEYVVVVVTTYCAAAENLFVQLTNHFNKPDVNFDMAIVLARDLYARTSSVGAQYVKAACTELVRACEEHNMQLCSQALYWTKNEFSQLRRRLERLVQEEDKTVQLVLPASGQAEDRDVQPMFPASGQGVDLPARGCDFKEPEFEVVCLPPGIVDFLLVAADDPESWKQSQKSSLASMERKIIDLDLNQH